MANAVLVDLTPEQELMVSLVLQAASEASAAGKKGVVLAQVFDGRMRVGFVPHEPAKIIQEALAAHNRAAPPVAQVSP